MVKDFKKIKDFLQSLSFQRFIQEQKLPVLLFVSFLISLVIFYFMSALILPDSSLQKRAIPDTSVHFLMSGELDDLRIRDRKLPEKPKPEEAPPSSPKLKIQSTEIEKLELETKLSNLDLSELSDTGLMAGGIAGSQDKEAIPSFRVDPIYPRGAAMQGVEGFVILKFDISETGSTTNISVLQSRPPQIFNSSAIQALRKWKYKPKINEGKPVVQKNLKVRLDFKLEDKK